MSHFTRWGSPRGPAQADPEPSTVIVTAEEVSTFGTPTEVALTDDYLFVEVRSASGTQVIWRDRADPAAVWSSELGGSPLAGELVAAEVDVVQIDQGDTDLIAWARDGGGSRSTSTGTTLGAGGQYLAVRQGSSAVVQPVTTATDTLTVPASFEGDSRGVAVAGDDVVVLDDQFTLTRYDIVTGGVLEQRPDICPAWRDRFAIVHDADERFTMVACREGGMLLDLEEIYLDYAVLERAGGVSTRVPVQLGPGLVVGEFSYDYGYGTAAEGVFGGVSGALAVPSEANTNPPEFDLDDAGTTVAYVDTADDVRAVDLTSIASPVETEPMDGRAPRVDGFSIGAEWISGMPGHASDPDYTVVASASDDGDVYFRPSGVARVELRYRQKRVHEDTFGDYVVLPGDTADVTSPQGSTTCWSARGVDNAGNVGAWTAYGESERCVTIGRKG
ncbi:hypothetical protein ACFS27_24115 [Promicromonospora vindobonensis]|uniref:Pyrroloquinoline-quinone binding quinoprotein n=1 Tax=Promicromonospora vindobonensis TaxID=195748 RepID=A0ABW5VYB2_9MICO